MGYFEKTCGGGSLGCRGLHGGGDCRPYYILHIRIKYATNVDQLIGAFMPSTKPVYYQVVVSKVTATGDGQDDVEAKQCATEAVRGEPEPFWDCYVRMGFDEFPAGESFLLEVLSCGSNQDPGTSSGVAVVGRAQIMVPTKEKYLGTRRHGLVKLTGSEKKVEGFIYLHMGLEVIWCRRYNLTKLYGEGCS